MARLRRRSSDACATLSPGASPAGDRAQAPRRRSAPTRPYAAAPRRAAKTARIFEAAGGSGDDAAARGPSEPTPPALRPSRAPGSSAMRRRSSLGSPRRRARCARCRASRRRRAQRRRVGGKAGVAGRGVAAPRSPPPRPNKGFLEKENGVADKCQGAPRRADAAVAERRRHYFARISLLRSPCARCRVTDPSRRSATSVSASARMRGRRPRRAYGQTRGRVFSMRDHGYFCGKTAATTRRRVSSFSARKEPLAFSRPRRRGAERPRAREMAPSPTTLEQDRRRGDDPGGPHGLFPPGHRQVPQVGVPTRQRERHQKALKQGVDKGKLTQKGQSFSVPGVEFEVPKDEQVTIVEVRVGRRPRR